MNRDEGLLELDLITLHEVARVVAEWRGTGRTTDDLALIVEETSGRSRVMAIERRALLDVAASMLPNPAIRLSACTAIATALREPARGEVLQLALVRGDLTLGFVPCAEVPVAQSSS